MPEFFPFIPGTETSRAARQHASDTSPLLGRFRAVPRPRRQSNPFRYFTTGPNDTGDGNHHPRDLNISGGGGLGGRRGGRSSASLHAVLAAGNRGSVHVGYGALIAASAGLDDLRTDAPDAYDDGSDDSALYDSDDDEGCVRACVRGASRALKRNVFDLWVAPRQGAVRRVVESWWRRWGLLVFLPAGLVRLLFYFLFFLYLRTPMQTSPVSHTRIHMHTHMHITLPSFSVGGARTWDQTD
jgi:hypothetical protein